MSCPNIQEKIYDGFKGSTGEIKDIVLANLLDKIIKRETGKPKILDVGCGDGHILKPFLNRSETHGIDISKNMLQAAANLGIITSVVDLETEQFPFSSNDFDIVVCSEVIEHLITPDNMLREINRVLRPNHCFLLTFPNINQPLSVAIQTLLDLPPLYSAHYKSPHFRDYTLRVVKWLLREFGFEITAIKGTHVYPFKNALSRGLAGIIPRLGEKVIIVSHKEGKPDEQLQKVNVLWSQREFMKPVHSGTQMIFKRPVTNSQD